MGREIRKWNQASLGRRVDHVGAVMVVGGGIAGMQASLDLVESGYKVYLVEKKSAIGGHMAQLDKTFPTNDCAMCTISPKLVETAAHLNIELLTDSELIEIGGDGGQIYGHGAHQPALHRRGQMHRLR